VPFTRPTIEEILSRLQGDFDAQLPDFDPFLPRAVLLAKLNAYGAAVHELNGRLERAARNAFADTAELEELERIGEAFGVTRNPGVVALGNVRIYGDYATADPLPIGTVFVNANGLRYYNPYGPLTIAAGTAFKGFTVYAMEVGSQYDMPIGAAIELEEPVTGWTAGSGEVYSSPIAGGLAPETDDAYRARVLARLRRRPQGGTRYDFERWMFESSSEWTRVWIVDPPSGSNVIDIFAVDDTLDPDGLLITPAAGSYTAAQAYIDADYRRPLCADVDVQAPTLIDLDPSITLVPNTTAVQDAVKQEIVQHLIRVAEVGGTLIKSELDAAISRAAGETSHTTTVPTGDVALSAGQLHVIGQPVFS
jgi:uncharacterized phage protein gp47/JayE